MALVQLADIFEPDPASRYFVELNTSKNRLVQSGIVGTTPELTDVVLSQGGKVVDMPFWDDLPHDTGAVDRSKVVTDDTTEITPAKMTTDNDIAAKLFRAQSFEAASVVKHIAGDDPVGRMIQRINNWWIREEQRLLLKTLTGIFASGGAIASTHEYDIAIEDGDNATAANKVSAGAINEARFLLGDSYDMLTGMIVHSTVFKEMDNLGLLDFERGPTFIDNTGAEKRIPVYGDVSVLIDDGMTTVAGTTSGFKYHSYLFGNGAFARVKIPVSQFQQGAAQNEIVLKVEESEGTGAGTAELISRWYGVLHPRGVKFQGSLSGVTGPSDTLLETAGSWAKVWLDKNIRIARLVTNG